MKIGFGSIQGYTHKKLEYNNQDFVLVNEEENYTLGLIADGCGSGSNSEVGAQLGLYYITKFIKENNQIDWKANLKSKLIKYSQNLANLHSENSKEFTKNFLLYTIIGFFIQEDILTIFSCGDGVIIVDDNIQIIDQNNQPKYINNELIRGETVDFNFQELTYTHQTIILGSDGLVDLMEGINSGMIDEYTSFEEFIGDERNFTNPIQLPKLLQKYSHKGILKDDCSIIMMKK